MKLGVEFNDETSKLIKDGYYEKHKKHLDESPNTLPYVTIPIYIDLGRKVKRRRSRKLFLDKWGGVMFWVLVVVVAVGWNTYQDNQRKSIQSPSSYSTSSRSGIFYADSCPVTTCNDGACSTSTGRGTCSHHGGVDHY